MTTLSSARRSLSASVRPTATTMSNAAVQATAFYRDVARTRKVWTVRDAGGYQLRRTLTAFAPSRSGPPFRGSSGSSRTFPHIVVLTQSR